MLRRTLQSGLYAGLAAAAALNEAPAAPVEPLLEIAAPTRKESGPNPFLVVGAAFVLGVVLARVIALRARADA